MRKVRLRPVSRRRQGERAEYVKVRKAWIKGRVCERCRKKKRRIEVHHYRGRIGRLLCDTRFFFSLCRMCHRWVHANKAEARADYLLSPEVEWNVYPGK